MFVNGNVILPDPRAGRRAEESSYSSIGDDIFEAVEMHNKSVSDSDKKVEYPKCTEIKYSRDVIAAARRKISKSKLGRYLGSKCFQEIKASVRRNVFEAEMFDIMEDIGNRFEHIAMTEGLWGAHRAIIRCFGNSKKKALEIQRATADREDRTSPVEGSRPRHHTKKSFKAFNGSGRVRSSSVNAPRAGNRTSTMNGSLGSEVGNLRKAGNHSQQSRRKTSKNGTYKPLVAPESDSDGAIDEPVENSSVRNRKIGNRSFGTRRKAKKTAGKPLLDAEDSSDEEMDQPADDQFMPRPTVANSFLQTGRKSSKNRAGKSLFDAEDNSDERIDEPGEEAQVISRRKVATRFLKTRKSSSKNRKIKPLFDAADESDEDGEEDQILSRPEVGKGSLQNRQNYSKNRKIKPMFDAEDDSDESAGEEQILSRPKVTNRPLPSRKKLSKNRKVKPICDAEEYSDESGGEERTLPRPKVGTRSLQRRKTSSKNRKIKPMFDAEDDSVESGEEYQIQSRPKVGTRPLQASRNSSKKKKVKLTFDADENSDKGIDPTGSKDQNEHHDTRTRNDVPSRYASAEEDEEIGMDQRERTTIHSEDSKRST